MHSISSGSTLLQSVTGFIYSYQQMCLVQISHKFVLICWEVPCSRLSQDILLRFVIVYLSHLRNMPAL